MFGAMLAEAWAAIWANRLRSLLTMLGMMIGVGAVVLMSAIGEGTQSAVKKSIESMGSNLFIVLSGSSTAGGMRMGGGAAPTLTIGDAEAIGELPGIAASAPIAMGSAQLITGSNNWSTTVIGTTPAYMQARSWGVSAGAIFGDADVRGATRVALLGQTVANNLFGDENPVGKTIRIKQSPYLVVGLMDKKGQSLDGRDQDDSVFVPVTTAQRKLFGTQFQGTVRFIMVQAEFEEAMEPAEEVINALLRQRHHIREGAEDDFTVRNLTAIADTAAQISRIMALVLGAIASISLLVGGIGIMNIMLVSVTERTREIGIRIAIGAKERNILTQFLLEALVISLIGCFVGVGIGIGGAALVHAIVGIPIEVTVQSVVVAFTVASGVGIFFGFYPARKAAKMEPIEALRYQ